MLLQALWLASSHGGGGGCWVSRSTYSTRCLHWQVATSQRRPWATTASSRAIGRRLATGQPFALLIAEPDDNTRGGSAARQHPGHDDRARAIAALIGSQLGAEDELARVGSNRFAILATAEVGSEVGRDARLLPPRSC